MLERFKDGRADAILRVLCYDGFYIRADRLGIDAYLRSTPHV